MRGIITAAFCVGAMSTGATNAEAKGCIKGALVGGIAGHFLHHGLMGAAAGCAVGHSRSTSSTDAPPRPNGGANAPLPSGQ